MPLNATRVIEIPASADTSYDHGAFEPKSRRVFLAHTGRDRVEVIDHDTSRHLATLDGFPEAAGVVADEGHVLVTNRGAASLAWIDAHTLETRAVFNTGPRPNGVAIVSHLRLAVVACIGDDIRRPRAPGCGPRRTSAMVDRAPRSATMVRDGCRGNAGVPRDPRALDGLGRAAAATRSGAALGTALGRRARPRHRSPGVSSMSRAMTARSSSSIPWRGRYATSGRSPGDRMPPSSIRRAGSCTSQSAIPGWSNRSTRAPATARSS